MFRITVTPRLGDVDFLGHVNNTVPAAWFELARNPLFKIFDPAMGMTSDSFPLIMAHADYDFVDQLFFHHEVEIRTWIGRIGTKSFTIHHEAWQEGRICVKGSAVIVHYDFAARQSIPIPAEKKKLLVEYGSPVPPQQVPIPCL